MPFPMTESKLSGVSSITLDASVPTVARATVVRSVKSFMLLYSSLGRVFAFCSSTPAVDDRSDLQVMDVKDDKDRDRQRKRSEQ